MHQTTNGESSDNSDDAAQTPDDNVMSEPITELELQHLRKLGALGGLAAGIAHEINTPIQFIGDNLIFLRDAFTTLLASRTEPVEAGLEDEIAFLEDEVPRAIEQASEGVMRVATIVRAMKTFSHSDRLEMQFANVEDSLQTTAIVARNEYKYVADLKFDLADIPLIRCSIGDLQQVFLNLIVNAAHAIEDVLTAENTRGTIGIKTRQDENFAVIEISDTGCGMPAELQEHIFEPFFTTKEAGRGTGQGLSIAHSIIVENHGGSIHVDSTVGEGTTFVVRIPIDGTKDNTLETVDSIEESNNGPISSTLENTK